MAKFLDWFEATRPTSDAAPSLNGLGRAIVDLALDKASFRQRAASLAA